MTFFIGKPPIGHPYWHEQSTRYQKNIMDIPGTAWQDVVDIFRQPTWCEMKDALGGDSGCWGLVCGHVQDEVFCKECMYNKNKEET